MNYRVRVDEQYFDVSIAKPDDRPIVANVDGEDIEVWLMADGNLETSPTLNQTNSGISLPADRRRNMPSKARPKDVIAPIPGVIVSVDVCEGDDVASGQILCILEAMKMKNMIRSPKAGKIAKVNITAGQIVPKSLVLFTIS